MCVAHCSLAKACLSAGRHVVLEKPMASTYTEAQELCSIAREKDRLLAVYQNRCVLEVASDVCVSWV